MACRVEWRQRSHGYGIRFVYYVLTVKGCLSNRHEVHRSPALCDNFFGLPLKGSTWPDGPLTMEQPCMLQYASYPRVVSKNELQSHRKGLPDQPECVLPHRREDGLEICQWRNVERN